MIKSFMASPKRFEQVDFDMIGSGTGVLRYAFGVYMGERSTAAKYYNDYQHYSEADQEYFIDGKLIPEGSPGHKVASYLIQNKQDVEGAQEHFKGNRVMTKALKLLTDDFTKIDFQTQYAALYEVKIPDCEVNELLDWDNPAGPEHIIEVGYAFLNSTISIEALDRDLLNKISEFEIYDRYNSIEDLLDYIYDAAYESADEQELFPGYIDKDDLKEVWDQYVLGDINVGHNLAHEFHHCIEQKYVDMIDSVKLMTETISLNDEMTNGDVYCHLATILNPEYESIEKNILGKKLASEFLAKEFGVIGYVADTMYGRDNAQEIIITNEDVAKTIRLSEVDIRQEFEDNYDEDMCY